MNRLSLFVLLAASGLCLQGQTFSSITIQTVPKGARFYVDGQLYTNAATLVWPTGSKHVVSFYIDSAAGTTGKVQTSPDGNVQYVFNNWTDNAGLLAPTNDPVQTVTADPRITTLTANLTVAYRVLLNLFNTGNPLDPVSPPTCGSPGFNPSSQTYPGVVFIGQTCYWATVNVYVVAGTVVGLNAIPFPGFVFTGWQFNSGPLNAYLTSITVNGPTTLSPAFAPGKRVHFLTDPIGMQVLVDHTPVPTRTSGDVTTCPSNQYLSVAPQFGIPPMCLGDFDFADGSKHIIGAPSPQLDTTGHWWVFNSFTNGIAANGIYTASNVSTEDTVTGKFDPGATVSFTTNPAGLQLNVDGRTNWPNYNFVWALGSTHKVTAPDSVSDSKGRKYTFQGWSNGGTASQTVTVDQNMVNAGMRTIASYSVLSRLVVQSSPAGQTVQVDGASCQTPCTLDRQNGTSVHVTAPTQIPMGAGARLDFAGWSDGGASDHVVSINQDSATLTVNYTSSYQLSATSNLAAGVTFQFAPSSPDLFYPVDTRVSVTAVPNPGFKFLRWGGDLTGTYPSGVVTMSVPHSVIAQLNAVPYIPPAGITNAVGATPNSAVAPGSIVSIYGQGLAGELAVGPVNPLSQTIGGVTVTVGDRILGLLFVSPQQINAQVPSDLADGQYTLTVHLTGQQDVSTQFNVARDAPGLFFNAVNSDQFAVAFHADGSAVTADNPAAAGETISLLGTGFGPYGGKVIDGFFPPDPSPALADAVSISVGDQTAAPTWSGAAPGFVGVALTRFQVPGGMSTGVRTSLKVTVNGADSNTVLLPVQ